MKSWSLYSSYGDSFSIIQKGINHKTDGTI